MSEENPPEEPMDGSDGSDGGDENLPPAPPPRDDIVRVTIEDEVRSSYIGYAMSVIIGRALPDIRDGLKPVHRRCLFGMDQMNNRHDRPYMKSARVAGDVMGKYHPHGDGGIYETLVRMAQDFNMRYPLVDPQGNFGSIDGDPPAASRYTELRMTRLARFLLADLDQNTVDTVPNYDETLEIPVVLPTRVPNLLINGSYGIAVAMTTNVPPHNLGEVIDACVALIDDENISVEGLMEHVQGPDFPTAGIINGRAGIVEAYRTGKGRILVRGRASVEGQGSGKETIVITEIPYQVNKAHLAEKIGELAATGRIEGIADVRDESSKDGLRVVIELKRGEPGDIVLNNLYQHSKLQVAYHINCTALVGGRPLVVNLKQMLVEFLEHRREVVLRRTIHQLGEAKRQAHILEGQAVALADIDAIVNMIRRAESRADALQALVNENWLGEQSDETAISEDRPARIEAITALLTRTDVQVARLDDISDDLGYQDDGSYKLSEDQANAILTLQLHRLVSLEQDRLIDEYEQIVARISELQAILDSEERLNEVIKEELNEVRDEFGDERRTEIFASQEDFTTIDMIAPMDVVVTISHRGYAKIQPISVYETQRRGGTGIKAVSLRDEDFVEHLLITHNHDTLLCFSNQGRVHWLPVYQIPEGSRTSQGRPLVNMIRLEKGERITAIKPVTKFQENLFVVMATAKGIIKRTELSQFERQRRQGLIALSLEEGDTLIGVEITDGHQTIMLTQNRGRAVRFRESDVRVVGRTARGVIGIRLRDDAEVISLIVPRENGYHLIATENGFGKRTDLGAFPVKGRGGLGMLAMASSDRNGRITTAIQVMEDDEVMLIGERGKIVRTEASAISISGRNTQGVRLKRLDDGERLVGLARIAESALARAEDATGDDESNDDLSEDSDVGSSSSESDESVDE